MNTIESIKEVWNNLTKRLNGRLFFNETEKANVNYGIVTAKINYSFNEANIEIHQGIFDGGKGKIRYNLIEISTKLTEANLILNLWRLDFLERLFNRRRMKTGLSDFDKTIGIECSDENLAYGIFNIWEIRREFILNRNLILNTIDDDTGRIIRMKSLIAPCEEEEIEKFARLFNRIVEQLQRKCLIGTAYKK